MDIHTIDMEGTRNEARDFEFTAALVSNKRHYRVTCGDDYVGDINIIQLIPDDQTLYLDNRTNQAYPTKSSALAAIGRRYVKAWVNAEI